MNVVFISCRKENNSESINPKDDFLSLGSNPNVINGMLHFDEYSDFEYFINDLQQQESDTSAVRNAYIHFGIDLTAEQLPNFTDHPVCLKKELEISGFSSARKQEEQVINAALDSGSDMFSIIAYPYFKTALNQYYAVYIGSRIFKFFDNDAIAIILNDDWNLYNTIKSLSFGAIEAHPNLIITSQSRNDWSNYYSLGSDKSVLSEISIYEPFFVSNTVNGQIHIINNSIIESSAGSQTFKWLYDDNTSSYSRDPNRTFTSSNTFSIVIDNGKGNLDTIPHDDIARCLIPESAINILNLGNGQFQFSFWGRTHLNQTLKWIFEDGTTSTQNPVIKSFNSDGIVTLQIHWEGGGFYCAGTKPYTITCGEQKRIDQQLERNFNGQTWRIDASIWVRAGNAGCSMKYLRKYDVGFLPGTNQGVCTEFTGNYNRKLANGSCMSVFRTDQKCLGNGTYPTEISVNVLDVQDIFRIPGQFSSSHKIKIKGTWFGFGVNDIPRLVLD